MNAYMPRRRRPTAPSFFTQRFVAGLRTVPFSHRFAGDLLLAFLAGEAFLGDLAGDLDAAFLAGDLGGAAAFAERRRADGEHEGSAGFQLCTFWLPTLLETYMHPSFPFIVRPAHAWAGYGGLARSTYFFVVCASHMGLLAASQG